MRSLELSGLSHICRAWKSFLCCLKPSLRCLHERSILCDPSRLIFTMPVPGRRLILFCYRWGPRRTSLLSTYYVSVLRTRQHLVACVERHLVDQRTESGPKHNYKPIQLQIIRCQLPTASDSTFLKSNVRVSGLRSTIRGQCSRGIVCPRGMHKIHPATTWNNTSLLLLSNSVPVSDCPCHVYLMMRGVQA
jgi:hypothetical protein